VLEPLGPEHDDGHDATVLSWVRSARRKLDPVLWRQVSGWLERDWPFERVAYAPRRIELQGR
jgi:hypothetical protein